MHTFPRPKVVISKCLGFEHCRYDGQIVPCEIVEKMRPFVEFVTVCPECEIGLGVPRDPILLVDGDPVKLVQPATNLTITEVMQNFVTRFLDELQDVDGFILKAKSPSCGLGTTKVFVSAEAEEPLHGHGTGFLAKGVLEKLGTLPHIDEEALMDPELREHFFTRLFMQANLRLHSGTIQELMNFHKNNKLLLMAYNQGKSKILGSTLASNKQQSLNEIVAAYANTLQEITSAPPSRKNFINAFMHSFGYFSSELETEKKQHLLNHMEAYRNDTVTLWELRKEMIPWIVEFEVAYLKEQTLFFPYPESLKDPCPT